MSAALQPEPSRRWSPAYLAELRDRTPLASLIRGRVELEKAGRHQRGCCPFHTEKTASFYVYADHFHCLGCGAHGDAIDWVRQCENLDFAGAVTRLAGDAGIGKAGPGPLAQRQSKKADHAPRAQGDTATYARKILAESVPIQNTAAETYLRHRKIAGELPKELRYHPNVFCRETGKWHPALILTAYDKDQLRRVQAVFLDPETGTKARMDKPKVTFGQGASHIPVVLAARVPGGPTLITEGPEDAISLWSATGWRTLATLGAGSLEKPRLPPGTSIIIFGDNDEAGIKAAHKAAVRHHKAGCSVAIAFASVGKDANETLQAFGPAALIADVAAATPYREHGLAAYYDAPTMPRDGALQQQAALIRSIIKQGARRAHLKAQIWQLRDAWLAALDPSKVTPAVKAAHTRRAVKEVLAEHGMKRLPPPDRVLLTGSQGSGKTAAAIQAVAELDEHITVWITEPTLEKAEEVATDYRKVSGPGSMPAYVVRGRSAHDPQTEGRKMCWRSDVARRAAQRGISVRKEICATCPFAADCGSLRQEREIAELDAKALFVVARNYLFVPCPAPSPKILIADESAVMEAPAHSALDPAMLRGATAYSPVIADTLAALADAMTATQPLLAMRDAEITLQQIKDAHFHIEAWRAIADFNISGQMSDEQINDQLDRLGEDADGKVLAVLSAIIREFEFARPTFTGIVYDPAHKNTHVDGTITVSPRILIHRLRRLHAVNQAQTTVLLLDGTRQPAAERQTLSEPCARTHRHRETGPRHWDGRPFVFAPKPVRA